VLVEDLKREIEEIVSDHQEIPYFAFVSGPEMNLRGEFNDYDADRHKPIVSAGLMSLIKRGANRIVIISEVWLNDDNDVPTSDGVMIIEATRDGDTMHIVACEGKDRLGDWSTESGGESGNLARLFAKAELVGRA
jgi:hypothetical protein